MGPIFYLRTRLELRKALRHRGMNFLDINAVMADLKDEAIDSVVKAMPEVTAAVGAFGDGSIIQAIIDFFASPAGQALIQALISILIGLI